MPRSSSPCAGWVPGPPSWAWWRWCCSSPHCCRSSASPNCSRNEQALNRVMTLGVSGATVSAHSSRSIIPSALSAAIRDDLPEEPSQHVPDCVHVGRLAHRHGLSDHDPVDADRKLPLRVRDRPWRREYLEVYCAFVGVALESAIIDIDCWRHFFLTLGLIWGLMAATRRRLRAQPGRVPSIPVPSATTSPRAHPRKS